jgi:hypothetical protein
MAVSGTNTFTQVKNQIIELAYSRIGVVSDENTLNAFQIQRGSDLLNIMIKSWIAQGVRLWKMSKGTLFLQPNVASYILDGTSANATTSYSETTTSASALAGATSITVNDATGFTAGYFIGILQDNGIIFWTTIASVVSTTITLTDALDDAVASSNAVFAYQTKISRPENIINADLQMAPDIEIEMALLSRNTYDAIAVKTLSGIPNQLYYNKQLNYGEMQMFPVPATAFYKMNFTFQTQFFDMTNPNDDFDFPVEWLDALYLGLASKLIGFNAIKDPVFIQDLRNEYTEAFNLVKGFDDDMNSIYFYPASDNNRGGYL